MFVDDIAVRATNQAALLHTLNHLHHVAYRMGLRFNADKTETYHWARNYVPGTIIWQGQQLTIRPPMLTKLGHVRAHPSREDHTGDMVINQLRHDLAAYKSLQLNGFEKVAIVNAVLIPCWTYRGLFLSNRQRMARWDDMLLQFLRETLGVEPRIDTVSLPT